VSTSFLEKLSSEELTLSDALLPYS
jgi:hypothetical protein